jgi:hypothetical protein
MRRLDDKYRAKSTPQEKAAPQVQALLVHGGD